MQQAGPDSAKASFDRAMTFMRAGDSGTAESICRKALNNFPKDANLLCLLGAALLQQRKVRDAEFTLTRTVRLFNNFARAHEMLAAGSVIGKIVLLCGDDGDK